MKEFDLRIDARGTVQPMAHGFFAQTHAVLHPHNEYDYTERCELVGCYWVEKSYLNPADKTPAAVAIRKFLAKAERAKKTSDAQMRAVAKYDAQNTKQIMLKLNRSTDADILAKLAATGNVQGYIKALIRADIAKQ